MLKFLGNKKLVKNGTLPTNISCVGVLLVKVDTSEETDR